MRNLKRLQIGNMLVLGQEVETLEFFSKKCLKTSCTMAGCEYIKNSSTFPAFPTLAKLLRHRERFVLIEY